MGCLGTNTRQPGSGDDPGKNFTATDGLRTAVNPWFNIFGVVLSVHDGHGYSNFDRFMPTAKVIPSGRALAGSTSVGVYFCADWYGPCTDFMPVLK